MTGFSWEGICTTLPTVELLVVSHGIGRVHILRGPGDYTSIRAIQGAGNVIINKIIFD